MTEFRSIFQFPVFEQISNDKRESHTNIHSSFSTPLPGPIGMHSSLDHTHMQSSLSSQSSRQHSFFPHASQISSRFDFPASPFTRHFHANGEQNAAQTRIRREPTRRTNQSPRTIPIRVVSPFPRLTIEKKRGTLAFCKSFRLIFPLFLAHLKPNSTI